MSSVGVGEEIRARLGDQSMIRFGQDICTDLSAACRREWLETNGIGGFASSTIIGLNTRRYHGLLTAATKPPVGRLLLLSKLEETLILDGQHFELSANQYPGVIHPQGYRSLAGFRLDPFPVFTYAVGGLELEKAVYMIHGENSTVIEYTVKGQPNGRAMLELRPLIALRDYHSTTHENGALDATLHTQPGDVAMTPYQGLPTLHLAHDADSLVPEGHWYRSFEYAIERERGLDWVEDLFHPCTLRFDLSHRSQLAVIAFTERRDVYRGAGRPADGDRGLSLVRRLGARYDDRAAWLDSDHGSGRCGAEHFAGVFPPRRPRHAAQSLPRCGRAA
jgi:glycogen debranching enzyme